MRLSLSVIFILAMALITTAQPVAETPTMTPLADELKKMAEASKARSPAAKQKKFAQGIADVEATGIVKSALNVGAKVPDSVLLTSAGKQVALSSFIGEQPVVLTFYRGGWCPYCNTALRALQKELSTIEGVGAQLIAVAPERPEKVAQTKTNNKLSLVALSDPSNELAGKLGIAFKLPEVILPIYRDKLKLDVYNGDQKFTLPLAATYVIDTQGVIRWAFLDADYKKRAEPADVVKAVQKLTGAISAVVPEPLIPHEQLAQEAGIWDAEMTMWTEPGGVPLTTTAIETNRMVGNFWLVSDFECEHEPFPFSGQMQLGYDPLKGKFVGSWVDTMSPYATISEGDYDIATRTLTLHAKGVDARTGKPTTSTMTTQYTGQDTKVFTIYQGHHGDKGWKMLEIRYSRRK